MITADLSILNQKGTPMFYSDTLALRPAFGIVGRIFIATDSPYGIFRDTGSAWDQIASGGAAGITGSGTLNTIAMFTPSGTAIGDSLITQSGINIVVARNLIVTNGSFTLSHIHPSLNGTVNPLGQQIGVTNTFQAGITWTALLACFNSSSLQTNLFNGSVTFGNGSYTTNNLNLSNITFNAVGSTITSTQASGGIRAYANQILQLRIDGTNNGTYTHYANSAVYGDFASSTARFTITNRYGYLVNNLDEYSAGHTYTNRWAFYNAGINDNNFFAGKVGIGSGYTPSTMQLDVNGTIKGNKFQIGPTVFSNILYFQVEAAISNAQNAAFTTGMYFGGINVTNAPDRNLIRVDILQNTAIARGAKGIDFAQLGANSIGINGTLINSSATGTQFTVNNTTINLNFYHYASDVGNAGIGSFVGMRFDQNALGLKYNATTGFGLQLRNTGGVIFHVKDVNTTRIVFGEETSIDSAQVAVNSTTKGFLPPRMTTAEKNAIGTPATGLVLFDTTLVKLCVYNGATWETVTSI